MSQRRAAGTAAAEEAGIAGPTAWTCTSPHRDLGGDLDYVVELAKGVGLDVRIVGVLQPLAVHHHPVAVAARRERHAGLPDAEALVALQRRRGRGPAVEITR